MVQFNLPQNSKILKGQYFKDKTGSSNLKIVHVYRWDPEKNENPREDTFEVNLITCGNKVLDILNKIKNEIDPGEPMETDLFKLTLDEIREKGIQQMPHTLREALEGLIKDNEFLKPVMTDDFIDTYQHYQFERQVIPDEGRPTAFEYSSTYSC